MTRPDDGYICEGCGRRFDFYAEGGSVVDATVGYFCHACVRSNTNGPDECPYCGAYRAGPRDECGAEGDGLCVGRATADDALVMARAISKLSRAGVGFASAVLSAAERTVREIGGDS